MIFRSSKYIINIWGPEHLIKYDEYTSLQPVDENLWYFKLILFDQTEFISLKIETSKYTTFGCKDILFRKSEFVSSTQFFYYI